jgi:hypothetical protein
LKKASATYNEVVDLKQEKQKARVKKAKRLEAPVIERVEQNEMWCWVPGGRHPYGRSLNEEL